MRESQRRHPVISKAVIQLRDNEVVTDGQLKSQRGLRIVDGLLQRGTL